MILLTVIYDPIPRGWVVLNLTAGIMRNGPYETSQLAQDSIEHGSIRDGKVVKYVSLELIQKTVQDIL